MKVLVRRGREDPMMTAGPTQPALERDQVSEEELNSEVELLRDTEILRTVAKAAGLTSANQAWYWKALGESPGEQVAQAVRKLQRRLSVEPLRKTTLINVTYASSDPHKAALVLQCLAAAYLERHSRLHRPAGEANFFEQQIAESRIRLQHAETQLLEFTRDQGVVSAAQERDIALQRLAEELASQSETRIAIAENAQRVRTLQVQLQSLPERSTTLIRNSDNPQLLGKIKSRLLELELKRTELLTKYAPSYRLVQEVDQQIAETKTSIAQEELSPLRDQSSDLDRNHAWAKGELVKAQVELSSLKAREAAAQVQLAASEERTRNLGERAVKQEELVNNLKAAEEQYLLYVSKQEEARIGDALDQKRILNVTIAEAPVAPELPQHSGLSVGLAALVFAGSFSTGMAFTADCLSASFRTPDEVQMYLGLPVLASLPRRSG
jgi:uncharacterized protein involved in exopolysaccharide biosynthesis